MVIAMSTKYVKVTLYIPEDLKKKIDELSQKEFKNISVFIRDILIQALKDR